MASTLELSLKESINYLQCSVLINEPGGQRQAVGIVMLSCQAGKLRSPAKGTAHMRVLVDRYLHTVTAAAYHYSTGILTFFQSTSCLVGKVRVVAAFGTVSSTIPHCKSQAFKMGYHFLFQIETRMVAGYDYCFLH